MPKIFDLEKKINELQKQKFNLEEVIDICKNILENSKNEFLKLRAKACLIELFEEDPCYKNIGYDLIYSHNTNWTSELSQDELLNYKKIKNVFDEVSFILNNTRYEEYENGCFFKRS